MLICTKCKVTLKCKQNGIKALWLRSHVRVGDEYECPVCGATVGLLNEKAHVLLPEDQFGQTIFKMED